MTAVLKAFPITKEIIPPKTCVGILHRGPYNEIGAVFKKLFGDLYSPSANVPPHIAGTVAGKSLGLYLDNPETKKPEDLRSYAAFDISEADPKGGWWPSEWETIEVGGGPAAVMTVDGSYDQLGAAWQSFDGRVKDEMGWTLSERPEHIGQEMYVEMDEKDPSKNVTKLIMFLEEK